jgi:hypothetical protein
MMHGILNIKKRCSDRLRSGAEHFDREEPTVSKECLPPFSEQEGAMKTEANNSYDTLLHLCCGIFQ